MMGWYLAIVAAICLLAFTLVLRSRAALPSVGSVAPEFKLISQEGNPCALRNYRGQWIVLYFYPRDLTPGCTIEARNFQADQAQYCKRNAVILGVSVDSPESHGKFCGKEGLDFTLLADTAGQVSKSYGSLMNLGVVKFSSRNTFLIDPQGNIARVFTGVQPHQHSREVLASLDELQAAAQDKAAEAHSLPPAGG
jgi:peroxiredoxin Q/BCP